MIAVVNLSSEDIKEAISLENSGSLRLHVELASPHTDNIVFLLIGDTQGILHVDRERRTTVDVRA